MRIIAPVVDHQSADSTPQTRLGRSAYRSRDTSLQGLLHTQERLELFAAVNAHFLINVLHMSLDCPLCQEHIGCDGGHSFLLGQKAEDLFLARRKTVEVTRLRNCHKRSRGAHRASLSPRVFSLASETALRNHLPVRVQTLLAQQQEARYNHRKRQNDAEARRQIPVGKLETSITGVPKNRPVYANARVMPSNQSDEMPNRYEMLPKMSAPRVFDAS